MRILTIITIVVAALVLVWVGFYIYQRNQPANEPGNQASGGINLPENPPDFSMIPFPNLTPVPSSSLPATEKIVVEGPRGGVLVNNFYLDAVEVYPWRDADIRKQDGYQITYSATDGMFYITIRNQPVAENISAAEAAFLSALKISRGQACDLNVRVGVMGSVDPDFSGRNLGLSFCR